MRQRRLPVFEFHLRHRLPVLWRHENLNDATHDWIRGEFAAVR